MAIDDLLSAGFDRMDLSLLASAAAVDEKLGHQFAKVETIADDQSLPRAAYDCSKRSAMRRAAASDRLCISGMMAAGVVVASGGTLAALVTAVVAAGGSGGGLIGAIVAKWIGSASRCALPTRLTGARRAASVG